MPAPGHWDALARTFTGAFADRYPGAWVPVPWAFDNEVHLCLQAPDPLHCNVIVETTHVGERGPTLRGRCLTVNTRATEETLGHLLQVEPWRLQVLGVGAEASWPILRDGDVIYTHPNVPTASNRSPRSQPRFGLSLLAIVAGMRLHGRWSLAVAAGFLYGSSWWSHDGLHLSTVVQTLRAPLHSDLEWDCHQCGLRALDGSAPSCRRYRGCHPSILALQCYLAAWGAPNWAKHEDHGWSIDLTSTCALQARLHGFWALNPLQRCLPVSLPIAYHHAWAAFRPWTGGVPDELFVATDGSGVGGGSCAFVVWANFHNEWFTVGWFSAFLPAVMWSGCSAAHAPGQRSFHGELVALQSAGLWLASALDMWRLHMDTGPSSITVAVDNLAALQTAAGYAAANNEVAKRCRYVWQAVQTRCQLHFRHVHSHVGIMVNTIADALAGQSQHLPHDLSPLGDGSTLEAALQSEAPWLWTIPLARLAHGNPIFHVGFPVDSDATAQFEDSREAESSGPLPERPQPLPLRIVTANVQSMRDATHNPFNPSGHAARRQCFYDQVGAQQLDVLCLQETRSRAGRWNTAGILTWRSGSLRGQYGCEIWIRPGLCDPPLRLESFSIVVSSPRLLMVTSKDSRLPVTIVSPHAPHADRPDAEAASFWSDLSEALHRAPPYKGLVLGIDANADFAAPDEGGCLIGDLLSSTEESRNDCFLLECCLRHSLEAPATFSTHQHGPGWSWEHSGGKKKRLDHLLFGSGPWRHASASQALSFDLMHNHRDHVALQVSTCLDAPAPNRVVPSRPICSSREAATHGAALWAKLGAHLPPLHDVGRAVAGFVAAHDQWRRELPKADRVVPKQPYISPATVACLQVLRDWRAHLRHVTKTLSLKLISTCLAGWRARARHADPSHSPCPQELKTLRQWRSALDLQVLRGGQRAHSMAKKDKIRHFLNLAQGAVDDWHRHGKPLDAICRLRWASRRHAERRTVHAAGGYQIEDALEEQFRAQEGGQKVTQQQLHLVTNQWRAQAGCPCLSAAPTLYEMEDACRRQAAGKAPGPDGISNEIWRASPPTAGSWAWAICTGIMLSGHEPFHFKAALVCALYKKGPASLPTNYRSIALLNGLAKIWHGHVRRTVGQSVLGSYDGLQLGGRRGVPVAFAVAAFRQSLELSVLQGRSTSVLFIDIQAAYYEASRQLIFDGDPSLQAPEDAHLSHLAGVVEQLLHQGALSALGVPEDEVALLKDCVAVSHWSLAGSTNTILATRGSRPGDGLADVLFGALFSIALRHIRSVCRTEGWGLAAAGSFIGGVDEALPLGWADDLAILTDHESPAALQREFPRVATVALSTLRFLRFRVNLGHGKTEAMLDIRGPGSKAIRGEMMGSTSHLALPTGDVLRITPEYRYLGVVQTPKDTGQRDIELSTQRARSAWAHARSLLTSRCLPWPLKKAWMAGRILPAAYATLATSIATSALACGPLSGFFERAARQLVGSWQYGHFLTVPLLQVMLGLSSPAHATVIARARLAVQLATTAPQAVATIFDAAWNRSTPSCELLADACRLIAAGMRGPAAITCMSLQTVRQNAKGMLQACRFLSRWGTPQQAFCDLWRDVCLPREHHVLGEVGSFPCALCAACLPSKQALAAHVHRKHSVVSCVTRYTHGTVCLWCNCEMFSTDRLKYHLRTTRACMHALRVTVGEAYEYGTGSKRRGERHHRGLPALRLPGPINATPAQRKAAAEGRACTEEELANELFAFVGVRDPWSWPSDATVAMVPPDSAAAAAEPLATGPHGSLPHATRRNPSSDQWGDAGDSPGRWWIIWYMLDIASDDWSCPSPWWPALAGHSHIWQLPRHWHRFWGLWQCAHANQPWSFCSRRGFSLLRAAYHQESSRHHGHRSGAMLGQLNALVAATVTLRKICSFVQAGGAVWIEGYPSSRGVTVLRQLLPSAIFFVISVTSSRIFIASHPRTPKESLIDGIRQLYDADPLGSCPRVQPLRACQFYRSCSLSPVCGL